MIWINAYTLLPQDVLQTTQIYYILSIIQNLEIVIQKENLIQTLKH